MSIKETPVCCDLERVEVNVNVTCDAVFACTVLPCSDVMVPVNQGESIFDLLFIMSPRISDCVYIFTHVNTFRQNREQSYLTVNNLYLPIKDSNYRLSIVRYNNSNNNNNNTFT